MEENTSFIAEKALFNENIQCIFTLIKINLPSFSSNSKVMIAGVTTIEECDTMEQSGKGRGFNSGSHGPGVSTR